MAQWIWKFGEFEAYHNLRVHSRRQQYGYSEPVVWHLYPVDPVVAFRSEAETAGGTIRISASGEFSVQIQNLQTGKQTAYGGQSEIALLPGKYLMKIRVCCHDTFPCLYVDGAVETGENWMADDLTHEFLPVGTDARFDSAEKSPTVFPFAYGEIKPVVKKKVSGGVLFDFGRETFARTVISGLFGDEKTVVRFGESEPEAMSAEWCVIRFCDAAKDGTLTYPPYAFRYIFVGNENAEIFAEYGYLPLPETSPMKCGDPVLEKLCEVAEYTFRLNCREFFLDGIKRDGWVWSGDTYQSLFVNRYLFHDADIERRTLIALGGKSPFRVYMNTIVDYTYIWFMSLMEYRETYGDRKFIRRMLPRMREIMAFCRGRVSADGFIRAREGDWSFIDWAKMDKTGAFCAEQILFARAMRVYSEMLRELGEDDDGCMAQAEKLEKAICERFFDEEKGAFIDSFESGKRNVTRQINILAYLYLPIDAETKRKIYENVVLNDAVPQITTPYFKFFEYQVYGMEREIALLAARMRAYYGELLETGATTLYEEFAATRGGPPQPTC